MKTAAEIIKERYPFYDEYLTTKDVELNGEQVQELINKARKETIIECAKVATISDPYQEGRRLGLRGNSLHGYISNNPASINKESILSLINELK